MKKFLIVMLAIVTLGLTMFSPVSYADSYNFNLVYSGDEITETSIETDIINFVYGEGATDFDDTGIRVDRTAGTDGEYRARDYLIETLKSVYGIAEGQSATTDQRYGVVTQEINYQTSLMSSTKQSYNVVAIQESNIDTSDYIVIGAHYDNYYGYVTSLYGDAESKSHGIYDNASGVVALLNVIKFLKDKDLPYDIYYVFFGAEECGNYGSEGFYQGFVKKYSGKMKLMINLDSIGNGDNLYMYADEIKTLHESYFGELSQFINASNSNFETIKTAPKNKKVNYLASNGNISYSHMGLSSDNSMFMDKGNNVISFFSGAWDDANSMGNIESSQNDNLMHTSKDNLADIKETYGDVFFGRIKQVVYLVSNALVQDDFGDMLDESSKTSGKYMFFTNSFYANLIFAGILVVALIVFCLYIKKFKKTANGDRLEKLKQAVMQNNIEEIDNSLDKKFVDKIEKEIIIKDEDKK